MLDADKRSRCAFAAGLIALASVVVLVACAEPRPSDDPPAAARRAAQAGDDSAAAAQVPDAAGDIPSLEPLRSLDAAVRAALQAEGNDPEMFPFRTELIDVNGDGADDGLALLQGPGCGTGGCSLYLFRRDEVGNSFILDSQLSLVQAPFILAEAGTDGWRDLILRVRGGGAVPATVILRHGDDGYPGNPSLLDPAAEPGPYSGDVLFPYGDLSPLSDFAGEYPRDVDLWNRDFLQPRLRMLFTSKYDAFVERMQTQGPVSAENGVYYLTGNMDNMGGSDAAILVADPRQNVLIGWLLEGGEMEVFREVPIDLPLPRDVQVMLGNWGG